MTPTVLVFIPMYNCQRQIARVLDGIEAVPAGLISEVLIVDNCSQDESVAVAQRRMEEMSRGPKIRLVRNDQNIGLGGSHRVAFEHGRGGGFEYCVTLHGDDQADIADLIRELSQGDFAHYDHYLGSRFHSESVRDNYSAIRLWGNRALNAVASFATGTAISDLGSGLNFHKLTALELAEIGDFPSDLTFDVMLLLYALNKKQRVGFFPIVWRHTDQKSNARVFQQGFKNLGFFARYLCDRKSLFAKPQGSPNGASQRERAVAPSQPTSCIDSDSLA